MQICVSRMLEESGIFFSVRTNFVTLRAEPDYCCAPSCYASWVLGSYKQCMPWKPQMVK